MGNIDKEITLPSQGRLGFDYGCGLVSLAYVFHLLGHISKDELKSTVTKLVSANGYKVSTADFYKYVLVIKSDQIRLT